MKIQNTKDAKNSVVVTPWASGDGKEPRQSQSAELKFEISLNGAKVKISQNYSKTGVRYQYANIGGVWSWTRDEFIKDAKYVTYVKPAKVEKEKVAEVAK